MEQTTLKKCTKCGEGKPATTEFFSHDKGRLRGACKSCRSKAANEKRIAREAASPELRGLRLERRKSYRQENADLVREQKRLSYERNREHVLAANKAFRERNRDWLKQYNSAYYEANREGLLEQKRRHYWGRPDEMRERTRRWRNENPEVARAMDRKRIRRFTDARRISARLYAQKRRLNPVYVAGARIRSRIHNAFKRIQSSKSQRTEAIIGISLPDFLAHIERQFLKGMTWENRSEWHIDHIIPLATAKTEEDVIRLNHYTNLRPLWAKDNLAKSDKVLYLI